MTRIRLPSTQLTQLTKGSAQQITVRWNGLLATEPPLS